MLSEIFRPIIEPLTAGAGRRLARARISPNMLTAAGLVATFGVAWLIASRRPLLAGLILIPTVILDVLDGALARASGRVTPWGGYLDSVADRVSDGALLAAVAWAAEEPRLLAAALAAMVLSFLVPYARAKAEALGAAVRSGPGERAERAVILILGLILGIVEAAMWTIAALATWTFAVRCLTVWRQAARP